MLTSWTLYLLSRLKSFLISLLLRLWNMQIWSSVSFDIFSKRSPWSFSEIKPSLLFRSLMKSSLIEKLFVSSPCLMKTEASEEFLWIDCKYWACDWPIFLTLISYSVSFLGCADEAVNECWLGKPSLLRSSPAMSLGGICLTMM